MANLLQNANDLAGLITVATQEFTNVWSRIGFSDHDKFKRLNLIKNYTRNLLKNMLEEELDYEKKLREDVKTYEIQILELSQELNVPVSKLDKDIGLLETQKALNLQLESLKQEKNERKNLLESLIKLDTELCAELGTVCFQVSKTSTPSLQCLEKFKQHLAEIEAEKRERQVHFNSMQSKIVKLLEVLELSPNTSFERSIICNSDMVALSKDNLFTTKNYLCELEKLEVMNKEEIKTLWTRVESLWTRLNTPQEERERVTQENQGVSQRVILSLSDELSVLEELRFQNMKSFVAQVREELVALWDKCFVPQDIRNTFAPFHCEEMSEELLMAHEKEVKHMQDYLEENHEMLQLVSKQQKLWKEHVEMEKRASQVSTERYCNRGGQLLKEEKMRKKIKIELPKVEDEVFKLIEEWERQNDRVFLVGGLPFKSFVRKQKDDWANEKENEKIMKQEQKKKLMEEEVMYGSKPSAFGGKRFANTPNKTPSKNRKIETPKSHFRKPILSPGHSASKIRDKSSASRVFSGCSTDTRSSASTDHSKPRLERTGSLQVLTPKSENKKNVQRGTKLRPGGSMKKLNFGSNVDLRNNPPNVKKMKLSGPEKHCKMNLNQKMDENLTFLLPKNPDATLTLHAVGHYEEFANDINKVSKNNVRSTLAPTFL